MISMVEKVTRLKIPGCEAQMEAMQRELRNHREAFLNAPEILDFEKDWMGEYIV